jgi:cytochrome c biogenesis protein ResB
MLRRLSSLRFVLFLLLALAVFGALGTAIPQGLDPAEYQRQFPRAARTILALGLDRYFTGVVYRSLLTLLTVSIAACALPRCVRGWRSFRGQGRGTVRVPLPDPSRLLRTLEASRWSIVSRQPLSARRRSWAFLGFPLTHLAPVIVAAGALWGSVGGSIGTKNIHLGDTTETVYNWSAAADDQLPFRIAVEEFRLHHYPLELRLRYEPASGEEGVARIRVGGETPLAGTPYRVRVDAFDPTTGEMVFHVRDTDGSLLGPFERATAGRAPVRIWPDAYRDPEVRRAEARIALQSLDGGELARQTVAINEPLVAGGYRIYLTAWGRDSYDFPYVGLQVVRDPGQPVVWIGSLLLCAGMLLMLFGEGMWLREEGPELVGEACRGRKPILRVLAELVPGSTVEEPDGTTDPRHRRGPG